MQFAKFAAIFLSFLVTSLACTSGQKKAHLPESTPSSIQSEETRVFLNLSEGSRLYERTSGPSDVPQHDSDLVRIDQQTYLKVPTAPQKMEHAQWVLKTHKNPVTILANKSKIEIAPHSAVQFRFAPLMQSDLRVFYGSVILDLGRESAYSEAVLRFEKTDFTLKGGLFFFAANATQHGAYLMNLKGAAQVKQPGIPALDAILVPAGSAAQIERKGLFTVKPLPEDMKIVNGLLKKKGKASPRGPSLLREILKDDSKSWADISTAN